jgi:CheY-like chemotaxis protein
MVAEKITIELDSKFLDNLFGMAGMLPPNNIELSDLNAALAEIKTKMNELTLSKSKLDNINPLDVASTNIIADGKSSVTRQKTVLVVDDLGIITYQLEMAFKKIGFEVVISNEIYDAIDKYKKQDFGFVIIDLFIPTEREGFTLLDEIKKLSLLCKLNTKIIVMTATAKPEYKIKSINRGADHYIEKSAGWQKEILDVCLNG